MRDRALASDRLTTVEATTRAVASLSLLLRSLASAVDVEHGRLEARRCLLLAEEWLPSRA